MLEEFLALVERWRAGRARIRDLVRAQVDAARMLVLEDDYERPVRAVAGVDVSFRGGRALAAAVVVDPVDGTVLEERTAFSGSLAPYAPGLLVFREGPVSIEAVRSLRGSFQVLIVNAHGLAHPRRCGSASHIGLLLDIATVGVASNRLCGEVGEPVTGQGQWQGLIHKGEAVGAVAVPAPGLKPIFVSPGHRISLKSSVEVVSGLLKGRRLPEPLSAAHSLAVSAMRGV